jgi:hypothetical protein
MILGIDMTSLRDIRKDLSCLDLVKNPAFAGRQAIRFVTQIPAL